MKKNILIFLTVLGFMGLSIDARVEDRRDNLKFLDFQDRYGQQVKFEQIDPVGKYPKNIRNINYQLKGNNLVEEVKSFLRGNSELLKLDKQLANLDNGKVQAIGGGGLKVFFQQRHKNLNVIGATIEVFIDETGKLLFVRNNNMEVPTDFSEQEAISEEEAIEIARKALKLSDELLETSAKKAILPFGRNFTLVWQVHLSRKNGIGSWLVSINAMNGSIISKINQLYYLNRIDGVGYAFVPNVVENPTPQLVYIFDLNIAPSPGLIGELNGRVVEILDPVVEGNFIDPPYLFDFTNIGTIPPESGTNTAFNQVSVYVYITDANNFFEECCGWTAVEDPSRHPLTGGAKVDITNEDGSPLNNAAFDSENWGFIFGTSSPPVHNLSNDLETVVHEFGHYISQVLNDPMPTSNNTQSRAMGEGISDVFAILATGTPTIGEGVFEGEGIRDARNNLIFPDDWYGEEHEDGKIISGVFWDILTTLSGGTTLTDEAVTKVATLLIKALSLMPQDNIRYKDLLAALLSANEMLPSQKKVDSNIIKTIFANRGITENGPDGPDIGMSVFGGLPMNVITIGGTDSREVSFPREVFYYFEGQEGIIITISVSSKDNFPGEISLISTVDGTPLISATPTDTNGSTAEISEFTLPYSGVYLLAVTPFDEKTALGSYTLSIVEVNVTPASDDGPRTGGCSLQNNSSMHFTMWIGLVVLFSLSLLVRWRLVSSR